MMLQMRYAIFVLTVFTTSSPKVALAQATTARSAEEPQVPGSRTLDNGSRRVAAALSPVPLYPPDGIIPESLKENYVFRALDSWDHIVSYPASLTGKPGDNQRIVRRIPSRRSVIPAVDWHVEISSDNKVQYQYTVANVGKAAAVIGLISLTIGKVTPPDPLDSHRRGDPFVVYQEGWKARPYLGQDGKPVLRIYASSELARISPGGRPARVVIESDLLPGLASAYFQAPEVPRETLADLPRDVLAQLDVVRRLEVDSAAELVITPKFSANQSKLHIAADYHAQISRLQRSGRLDVKSQFIVELLNNLQTFLAQFSSETPIEDRMTSYATLAAPKAPPSASIEMEIYNSVQVALAK